jgi:hypothetical protein
MKTAWMIGTMAAMGLAAHAAGSAQQAKRTITVYTVDHRKESAYPLHLAEQYASRIFATAGLTVEWRSGAPAETPSAEETSFVVELTDRTPGDVHAGALAYALPYEGVHIRLFFDRISALDKGFPDAVLAHVLAHEITHMLEGVSRHSKAGVMKPVFTPMDVLTMRSRPMSFAQEDVILIDLGLKRRAESHRAAESAIAAEEE